jgi:hypothetical protein
MERSGYYTLIQLTPERLIFTRTRRQRHDAAIALSLFGLVALVVAAFSFVRPVRDIIGFIFFLLAGTGLLIAALLSLTYWTEIEFNAQEQHVVKQRHAFGKVWIVDTLPYSRFKSIRVVKSLGEYDLAHLKLILPSGRVWATLPGYFVENQAQAVRRRIHEHMHSSPRPGELR